MNQYFNFVMVSKSNFDSVRITNEIKRNKLYRIENAESGHQCLERLKQGGIHAMIFNFDTLNVEKTRLLTTIREVGFPYPMIIFAATIAWDALDIVQKIQRVVIIEKPFESKDVWGICEKLLQGRRVAQRVYRRYYTDQSAAIEKTNTGETLDGRICNLSKGGAYMELGMGKVSPGELVKVTISLDKLQRAYNVDAEVIWCNSNNAGVRSAGLRFVQSSDVYRNLLSKL